MTSRSSSSPPNPLDEEWDEKTKDDRGEPDRAVDVSGLDYASESDAKAAAPTKPTAVPPNPAAQRSRRLATLPMGILLQNAPGDPELKKKALANAEATGPQEPVSAPVRINEPADTTTPWGVTPAPQHAKEVAASKAHRRESRVPPSAVVPEAAAAAPARTLNVTGVVVTSILATAILGGAMAIGGALVVSKSYVLVPRDAVAPPTPAPASTPAPAPSPTLAHAPAPSPSHAPSPAPSPTPAPAPKPSSSASTNVASAASASAASDDVPPDLLVKETGQKPSKASTDRMVERLRPALEACAKGLPKAIYLVHIDFDGPTGLAVGVESPNKPLLKTVRGGCVERAALDARISPFAGPTFGYDVKFAPK